MATQKQWLLSRLRRAPITPIEALHEAGIMRLAARIADLRADGHVIDTKTVHAIGNTAFARYVYVSPPPDPGV